MTAREGAVGAGTLALVGALGLDAGGFAPTAWGWSAIAVLAVLAALLVRGAPIPGRLALVFLAGLTGLTAWVALSLLWTSHVSATVLETQRLLLYAAAAAVFVLTPSRVAALAGVLAGAASLCGLGLVRWLVGTPEVPLSADPDAASRLSEPLGYANGVAILAVLGALLAVGFAARAERLSAQALAAAAVPLLAATVYLTLSRGAWLALGAGLATAMAAGPRRLQLAGVALGLAPPAAIAAVAAAQVDDGAAALGLIGASCALAGATAVAVRRSTGTPGPAVRRTVALSLAAIPVVLVLAAGVRLGGPRGAWDAFTAAPTPVHGSGTARVFSVSGSSRADYWSVALETWRDDPLLGAGGGTYARAWLLERPVPQPVKDAHSLYLETLAELGPLGLALILLALGAPLLARRGDWAPVALGPYAAFLAHAAQDWDWELPAVTVAALVCGSALAPRSVNRPVPRLWALLPALLCAVVVPAYLGNRALAQATSASDRAAYAETIDAARRAKTLQPWSADPWRVLGEAQLATGDVERARASFLRGLDVDPGDWELWLDLGLASDGAAQERAWRRAGSLNPLSPELQELGLGGR